MIKSIIIKIKLIWVMPSVNLRPTRIIGTKKKSKLVKQALVYNNGIKVGGLVNAVS